MSRQRERVVLAYSGGLDTSCILKWLLERGYHVICYMANVGQDEDLDKAREKALLIGASEVVVEDLRQEFVIKYVWASVQAGLVYEGRYLLGTALARPCIAGGLVRCARTQAAFLVAHGATGKGNDQVRFELACYALAPDIQILAPWRMEDFIERFRGRPDLLLYAEQHGIPVSATPSKPWSTDANLLHVSYEAGVLEEPANEPPENLYLMTMGRDQWPDLPCRLQVRFEKGLPVEVLHQNMVTVRPLDMLVLLNRLGGEHGIGRIDIVENRFIGLKSRGVYETPGGHILHVAHADLEVMCLDREVLRVKQALRDRLADYVYNGLWFSPEAEYAFQCVALGQRPVSGLVTVELYKGHVRVLGREAVNSLYNKELVSMDEHSTFKPADATGFINIQALRLKEYYRVNRKNS